MGWRRPMGGALRQAMKRAVNARLEGSVENKPVQPGEGSGDDQRMIDSRSTRDRRQNMRGRQARQWQPRHLGIT